MKAIISAERNKFHNNLLAKILSRNSTGIPSNADKDSKPSIEIASSIYDQIGGMKSLNRLKGQTSGAKFEGIVSKFIDKCISQMSHLRPGQFFVAKGGKIFQFDQFSHLDELQEIAKVNKDVATALGSDYLIKPDIVVGREAEDDAFFNTRGNLVDEASARLTSLRKINQTMPILHASISCKWTLRSDRAQNARSEGLNLVRNRKGKLPHIAVVTAEPLPTRVASLAMGTGDIDCVYHFALDELRKALEDQKREETLELLLTMIEGKRLRDISDLPIDLVI